MHIHVMNVFAYRYDISGSPTSFWGGAVVSKAPLLCSGRCTSSNYCFNWSLTSRVCDYGGIFITVDWETFLHA